MSKKLRVIAWADAGQESLLRDAAALKQLQFIAVGSSSSNTAAELARALKAEKFADLRHAIHRDDVDLLWLAGYDDVDREVLRLIDEVELPAFTSHPQPASLSEARAAAQASPPRFVPLMRRSSGFRAAMDVLTTFGAIGAVNVSFRCGEGHGGLFARLYDAMDVIDHLCGDADVMDAAIAGPLPSVPDALGDLRGHMTINIRFPENRCACVAVSDGAGTWFRGVNVLGDAGCLRISDDGFEWIDPAGKLVDSFAGDKKKKPDSAGALAVMHIMRVMENMDASEAPQTAEDNARLLAICEAARLSCLTGHGASPGKVLQMLSRP